MYKVYWTGPELGTGVVTEHAQLFDSTEMTDAMKFMEHLRTARRAGALISFVGMVSENPNSVGQAGVDVTGPGYKDEWDKKHRGAGPSA